MRTNSLAALVFDQQISRASSDVAPLGGQLGQGVGLVGGSCLVDSFFCTHRLIGMR